MLKFWRRPAAEAASPAWAEIVRSRQVAVDQAAELARARNPAEAAFYAQTDRLALKWHHYLEVYDRHLSRYRGKPVRLLELGVFHGGSLQMWRRYFGEAAVIHGIDVDPRCGAFDDPGLHVHIGSQADPAVLERAVAAMGGVDVVIDDGSHRNDHQIASFEHLYPRVAPDGVYIVEDVHSSYWPEFQGGLRRPGSFIEFAKRQLDRLNARYVVEGDAADRDTAFADMTHGIAFHDSMVVFEKRPDTAPWHTAVGHRTLY
jgi:cephalosporin hydroxylase